MEIQLLGAHNIESRRHRMSGLLVDGVLAVDCGSLTSSLSFEEQLRLRAVLLTHQHYDHVRDIPALGMNFYLHEKSVTVGATRSVYEALTGHLLNDALYPNFLERPPENPTLRFREIAPGREEDFGGYNVLALPVNHAVPTVGFRIIAPDGKTLFYTSDTGPGLSECWRQVKPDLLITELTAPDGYGEFARHSGHLTPAMLRDELGAFREIHGYLPRVALVHMNPLEEKSIAAEVAEVASSLGAEITLGCEGMLIKL